MICSILNLSDEKRKERNKERKKERKALLYCWEAPSESASSWAADLCAAELDCENLRSDALHS